MTVKIITFVLNSSADIMVAMITFVHAAAKTAGVVKPKAAHQDVVMHRQGGLRKRWRLTKE